jgi:predicted nucleotidyltransferase
MSETLFYICKLIKEFAHPEKMWLYGSHAKGTASKFSDIDVCLLNSKKTDEQIKRHFKGFRLDVTVIDNARLKQAEKSENSHIHDAIKGIEI